MLSDDEISYKFSHLFVWTSQLFFIVSCFSMIPANQLFFIYNSILSGIISDRQIQKFIRLGELDIIFSPPFHFLPCWDSYSLLRALWQNRGDNATEWERSPCRKKFPFGEKIFLGAEGEKIHTTAKVPSAYVSILQKDIGKRWLLYFG